jgi:hypothetical protein
MPANVTSRHHRVLFTPRPRAAHRPFRQPISTPSPSPRSLAAFPSLSLQPYPCASRAISTTPIPATSATLV